MDKHTFKEMVDELKPILKKLSTRNRFLGFIDKDDLYQEALINLWNRFESGQLQNKNKSYILRSCYFHIQNYIRTHKVRGNVFSLDEPIAFNENGSFSLQDMLIDENADFVNQLNRRLIVDEIMNNGLSKREKDVFRLLYAGCNLREAARKLGISHVRVLKIKQNIGLKYGEHYKEAL